MPDTLTLQGKVAIVTGSDRENGIGAGIALALARNGASVVVNYVSDSSKHRAENVCAKLREYLVEKTLEGFGIDHIDILVNNAATAFFCPITDEPNVGQLTKVFQLNVLGAFYMVHCVIAHMPPGSRIINISSTNAKRGNVAVSAYAASKAALDSLTWTWAGELGRSKGITVNSVAPGPVRTEFYPKGQEDELMKAEVEITRAADRPGTPEDIGDAVLLLVQERSRWITGQYIGVSGGVTY
ncbi:hypothetical protein H9Q69_008559 [Fusarium xylarioides]|uniref:Uncharacterized protein n=1 Tax=Fusarium xylarioides TaxID=221167 RepID=A0A9P7IER5_9HYPO|nr:hypothetical protein H9Q70_008490 [Fusarium xylarioides]KAG5763600.1 hypothetical protein H9Q72_008306 [Fusarium xylarioides]KAG5783575.1 hypothetical protein H9Q73_002755 [Fusarium xylarioides]KAG5792402.1 hypothetical protein H9Q69_008559 [Fusarium xylarioides]KAG5805871.1 hypothetical protein H9Q71_009561 [Fusarium xylarioides]